jgi:hypothetical protein
MFDIDDKDVKRLERELKTFAKRALPFATKNTLNRAAFDTQRESKEIIERKMITRNRFTLSSIRVDQARTLVIRNQSATVGSIADYMEDQEFGTTKASKGKEGVSIATGYAAGQEGQRQRTRLPRKPNRMQSIQLQRRRKKGATRRQQNFIAIKQAAESGRKFVFLDLGRRRGIFRVVGGKRKPRIKMVHDMTKRSVIIPRNPWLSPAVAATSRRIAGFYADSLRFQLKRQGLFQ